MNKQEAKEQMLLVKAEMDKLQAIIDKPESKVGRVISINDLCNGARYYTATRYVVVYNFCGGDFDKDVISHGLAFHDKETAEQYLKYLKLEQELRRAQAADGGTGGELVIVIQDSRVINSHSVYFHKVSFYTPHARDSFRATHTDEQLTLLIRGV